MIFEPAKGMNDSRLFPQAQVSSDTINEENAAEVSAGELFERAVESVKIEPTKQRIETEEDRVDVDELDEKLGDIKLDEAPDEADEMLFEIAKET